MAKATSIESIDTKQCFIISPIGEDLSDTRKRADQVLKHLIRPALELCGYKAVRADEIDKPGLITSQVIQCVVNDELVIADLSETNPNVFYELAIRHSIRKPLIQIIQKGERIPFDVGGMRTISFDHQDLDSVAEAKDAIIAQIKELEANPTEMETPISVSIELQKLRQSDNPDDRSYADLLAAISDVRGDIQAVALNADAVGEATARAVARRIEDGIGPRSNLFPRRLHPGMIEELMMGSREDKNNPVSIAILASMYREVAPWVFELGMEAYRQIVSNPGQDKVKKFMKIFIKAAHDLTDHPVFRENTMRDKSLYRALEFAEHMLFRVENYSLDDMG